MSGKGRLPRAKSPPSAAFAKSTDGQKGKKKKPCARSATKEGDQDKLPSEELKPPSKEMSMDECVKQNTQELAQTVKDNIMDPGETLNTTLEKLKIKRAERSENAKIINTIIKLILDHMKENTICFRAVKDLRTGSYYENLKISNPDEFDVMLTVPDCRVDIQKFGDDGAFYSATLKRGTHPLKRFSQQDNTISAFDMLKEFRKEVKICVKSIEDVKVEKKKKGCPAVTLEITKGTTISLDIVLSLEIQTSWPPFTKDGFRIEGWLGTKVKSNKKREPYYLVPKYEGRGTKEREGIFAKDAWRISFSNVEKAILKNHGSQKTCCEVRGVRCCRKDCLKLLKHLLGLLKDKHPSLSKFCSYLAKTTLLHACCSRTKDSQWEATNLSNCFQQLLEDFENYLRDGNLPNFFIPTQNLLSGIDHKSSILLAQHISDQRNNGFPIFT